MQSAGPRIEVMRFSLLIVLTVALLSVAFRIHSHPSSSAHGRSPLTHTSPSTPTHVLPSSTTRPPVTHPTGSGTGTGTGTGTGSTPTLPVTGWGATLKLGAIAFVLIGGGTLSLRAAGPRRQRPETVQD